MNSIKSINLSVFLLICIFLFACNSNKPIPVWKLSKEGKQTSYLVGTTPFLKKEMVENSIIFSLLDSCSTLITLIDERNSSLAECIDILGLDSGQTLKNLLPKKEFDHLSSLKTEWNKSNPNNIEPPDSSRLKIIFYLSDLLEHNRGKYFYLDGYLRRQAHPKKMTVTGFESMQEFYSPLSKISLEEQIKFLNSIENLSEFDEDFEKKASRYYSQGNYGKIHQLYLEEFPYLSSNYNSLFTQRHNNMATQLDTVMTNNSCFVPIPVLHCAGKDNLLDKLLFNGYQVEKIQ